MLKKSHISSIKAYSDEWYTARLAKFTSSKMHLLTYPKGFTDGSIRYIRERVGEELTGKSADREIDTDATRWGHFHEAAALQRFGHQQKLKFVVTQQLITDPEGRFGSTPDSLIVVRESPDGLEYEVETVEVKCPPTFANYIGLFECNTPEQVKEENREYYWQKLDQMDQCGAKKGYLVFYHPDFKAGNHKIIPFQYPGVKIEEKGKPPYWTLHEDLKLLRERKRMAEEEFDRIRSKLMAVPAL